MPDHRAKGAEQRPEAYDRGVAERRSGGDGRPPCPLDNAPYDN